MAKVTNERNKFFLNNSNQFKTNKLDNYKLKRNNPDRKKDIDNTTKHDAKVDISDAIKDFARIKKSVDDLPEANNRDKIESLKAKIGRGEYKVDYDELADKILKDEMNLQ